MLWLLTITLQQVENVRKMRTTHEIIAWERALRVSIAQKEAVCHDDDDDDDDDDDMMMMMI